MISSPRSSIHNQKAKLAADYNDLLRQLSSPKITVIGCYTIGDTIGEGTYGKVKLGTHQITGKQVAIKKISKQHAPLMAREIHHHRQLRHPNIVALYEVLSTESAIFIVSEYCPNGELFDLLTETGRFTEQQLNAISGNSSTPSTTVTNVILYTGISNWRISCWIWITMQRSATLDSLVMPKISNFWKHFVVV